MSYEEYEQKSATMGITSIFPHIFSSFPFLSLGFMWADVLA